MLKSLLLSLASSCLFLSALAQPADAPYLRFPTLPPIQLLLADSTTKYTKTDVPKNKPLVVMVFSPECSHCRQMAGDLPKFREELKGITFIMATMYGLAPMKDFARTFNLSSFSNVVVGKDMYFLLPPFYGAKNLPFFAFYDKKGKLLSVFEGSLPLEQIISRLKKKA